MNIIVYTTTTCPYCKMLKDYLTSKNLKFVEKLVDQDDAAREEMSKESNGFLGVPFSVITNDGRAKEHIIGFDQGKLDEIISTNDHK